MSEQEQAEVEGEAMAAMAAEAENEANIKNEEIRAQEEFKKEIDEVTKSLYELYGSGTGVLFGIPSELKWSVRENSKISINKERIKKTMTQTKEWTKASVSAIRKKNYRKCFEQTFKTKERTGKEKEKILFLVGIIPPYTCELGLLIDSYSEKMLEYYLLKAKDALPDLKWEIRELMIDENKELDSEG